MSSTDPKSASFQEKVTSFYKRNEAAVKLGLASVVTLSVCGMVYYVIRKERRKRTSSLDNSSEEQGEGEEVDIGQVSSMGGSSNNSGSSNSIAPVQKKKKNKNKKKNKENSGSNQNNTNTTSTTATTSGSTKEPSGGPDVAKNTATDETTPVLDAEQIKARWESLTQQGIAAYKNKEFQKATELFTEAYELGKDNSKFRKQQMTLLFNRAIAHEKQGNDKEARDDCASVLAYDYSNEKCFKKRKTLMDKIWLEIKEKEVKPETVLSLTLDEYLVELMIDFLLFLRDTQQKAAINIEQTVETDVNEKLDYITAKIAKEGALKLDQKFKEENLWPSGLPAPHTIKNMLSMVPSYSRLKSNPQLLESVEDLNYKLKGLLLHGSSSSSSSSSSLNSNDKRYQIQIKDCEGANNDGNSNLIYPVSTLVTYMTLKYERALAFIVVESFNKALHDLEDAMEIFIHLTDNEDNKKLLNENDMSTMKILSAPLLCWAATMKHLNREMDVTKTYLYREECQTLIDTYQKEQDVFYYLDPGVASFWSEAKSKEETTMNKATKEDVLYGLSAIEIMVKRGCAHLDLAEVDNSLSVFEQAKTLNPKASFIYLWSYQTHLLLIKNPSDAEEVEKCYQTSEGELTKCIEIDEKMSIALVKLASLKLRANKTDGLGELFERARKKLPRSSELLCSYSEFKMSINNDLEDGLRLLEKAIALDNSNPVPLEQKGILNLQMGDFPNAKECFEKCLELDPLIPRIHLYLASAEMQRAVKQEDFQKAFEYFDKALKACRTVEELEEPLNVLTVAKARLEAMGRLGWSFDAFRPSPTMGGAV